MTTPEDTADLITHLTQLRSIAESLKVKDWDKQRAKRDNSGFRMISFKDDINSDLDGIIEGCTIAMNTVVDWFGK
jgi:hypothetical protein